MTFEALTENHAHTQEIIRELYVFTNQFEMIQNLEVGSRIVIDTREKKLLRDAIISLTAQIKILNNSIPDLIHNIGFYKELTTDARAPEIHKIEDKAKKFQEKFVQVRYMPDEKSEKVSLTISDQDRKEFLENLSKSNLSIRELKKKYSVERPSMIMGRPNAYAKISNRFFRKLSNSLIAKGYFERLNRDLRKINSPFVLGSYVSMIFFTIFISFIFSIILFLILLFVNISFIYPFLTRVEGSILLRAVKVFWVTFAIPIASGLIFYFYPHSESKNMGSKIDQELPFVTIHMSAIATSGIEPLSIFKIIMKSGEYKYTDIEFRKVMNLVNFHGKNLVRALRDVSFSSPSAKLRELLNGMATTVTSGGSLSNFLTEHSETMLFDYKLERERYTKTSETFMDIYIAVVIAAPMILLMLFIIIGSTGTLGNFLGLPTEILGILIILVIVLLNIIFLALLRMKQPAL